MIQVQRSASNSDRDEKKDRNQKQRKKRMAEVGETRDLDMVKLISADGHTFFVDTKAAMVSGTIKSMLSGPGLKTSKRLF